MTASKPGRKLTDPVPRFWAKVRKMNGCWLWTASKYHAGHGQFSVGRTPWKAHRYAWFLEYGSVPAQLNHVCGVAECINPAHLYPGTALENARDSIRHGVQPAGETCGRSKLTWAEVNDIRRLYSAGGVSYSSLGKRFGVSKACVAIIVTGKTWRRG